MNNIKQYNKQVYPYKLLLQAISDYSGIADIDIRPIDNGYICTFNRCRADTDRVIAEFNNYLIELANLQRE